jgi:hypothetical protein
MPDTDSDFFVLRDNVHHSVLIVLGGKVPDIVSNFCKLYTIIMLEYTYIDFSN